jgi:Ca2+-binding EF-hand superfamily protein
MKRFDANGDEQITRNELPESVRLFGFRAFDRNRDERIDHDEIQSQALSRFRRQ